MLAAWQLLAAHSCSGAAGAEREQASDIHINIHVCGRRISTMADGDAASNSILPGEYQKDEGLRTLANFLRSENGVKLYKAVQHEKRVEYFKGKNFIEVLTKIGLDLDTSKAGREKARKWPKSIPKISDVAVAIEVGKALLNKGFLHRSEKQETKKGSERILTVSGINIFEETGVYTWMYQGNMMWTHVMSGSLIAVVIGFTLLPIWPEIAKKVLWYISVTVLIAMLALCLIRFLAFLVMWILGKAG